MSESTTNPLDDIDREILAILQADGRLSGADIGRKVNLSQPAVSARIQRLERSGVITGYRAVVDPTRIGLNIHAVVRVRTAHARIPDALELFATLEEVIELAQRESKARGRTIGIYPETKHPTYHRSIGLPLEPRLVHLLKAAGWDRRDAPVFIQSFEQGNLKLLRSLTKVRLVQLIDRIPAIAPIQADGCAPMVLSWKKGLEKAEPVLSPKTRIETLATGDPGRTYVMLRKQVNETNGVFESVSDEDAFRAMHVLAKMEGISAEPASGVAFAGLFKLVRAGIIKQTALKRSGEPEDIANTVLFLVRDAPYITGQIIAVDGGRSVGW